MKRQRLSAVISLLAHLANGLGLGVAVGAAATWYAWDEHQRLKRIERYGLQTTATVSLPARTVQITPASANWSPSSGGIPQVRANSMTSKSPGGTPSN